MTARRAARRRRRRRARAGAAAAGGGNASAAEVGQLRAELASATSMVSAMASRVAELEKLLEAKLGLGLRG